MYFRITCLVTALTMIIFLISCKKDSEAEHPYTIGQSHNGGIIFYIDGTGEHGLICASTDQSEGIAWQNGLLFATNITNTDIGAGFTNTTNLVSILFGEGNFAAQLCYDLELNGYNDWFLPSLKELSKIYTNLATIDIGNFPNNAGVFYWSSSENGFGYAWAQDFKNPIPYSMSKAIHCRVRAARVF